MVMGIIGSLELYLGIQNAMELELKQSKEFYTLAIHLYKTLSLLRENRLEDGKEYLNEKYSLYIKLCESSNLLDRRMKSDLLAMVPDNMKYESSSSVNSEESRPSLHGIENNMRTLENLEIDASKLVIKIPNMENDLGDSPLTNEFIEPDNDEMNKNSHEV